MFDEMDYDGLGVQVTGDEEQQRTDTSMAIFCAVGVCLLIGLVWLSPLIWQYNCSYHGQMSVRSLQEYTYEFWLER